MTDNVSAHDEAVLNRIFNPNLPYDGSEEERNPKSVDEEIETEEVKAAKGLEKEGVEAAEAGDIQRAIDLFTQAINIKPSRPSGYNNRAQALRLKGDNAGALEDLCKAIEVSSGKGNVACQAYTQRALLYKLEGDEEKSLEDFKCAANLGGQFAKQQVVAMNPYAALCNQMLGEVMQKVRRGEM